MEKKKKNVEEIKTEKIERSFVFGFLSSIHKTRGAHIIFSSFHVLLEIIYEISIDSFHVANVSIVSTHSNEGKIKLSRTIRMENSASRNNVNKRTHIEIDSCISFFTAGCSCAHRTVRSCFCWTVKRKHSSTFLALAVLMVYSNSPL